MMRGLITKFQQTPPSGKRFHANLSCPTVRFAKLLFPAAAVGKLNIEMFGVEPEHRDGRKELSRQPAVILTPLRSDRLGPPFPDAVAETEPTPIPQTQHCLSERFVRGSAQKFALQTLGTGHDSAQPAKKQKTPRKAN